jgi:hypothetical protein
VKIVSCDCDVGKQNEKRREEERRGTKWKGKEEHNGNDEKIRAGGACPFSNGKERRKENDQMCPPY